MNLFYAFQWHAKVPQHKAKRYGPKVWPVSFRLWQHLLH